MSSGSRHSSFHSAAAAFVAAVVSSLALAGAAAGASEFFIRGGGYGHGIGMSQYGAEGYAEHGKDYKYILAHYYQGTTLSTTSPNQSVRVLLGTGSAGFSGANAAAGKTLLPSTTYTVKPLSDGSLGVFNAAGKRVARGQPPLTATGPGPLTVAGLGSYRGSLEFRPDGSGGVETVEAVGLDDYVRGVIAKEIPSSWDAEALEAQAVAARTYAITTNAGGSDFDVYPDTRSQMYGGVAAETPATDAAVAATRGQVVTYDGKPAVTYFFSSSGGYTENIENVWPGATPEPWLRGVPDPYDGAAGDPYHHWGSDLSVSAAAAKLGSLVKGSLVGIQVTKHGASPRILTANVVGTKGKVSVTGGQLQQIFGLQTTYVAFTVLSSSASHATATQNTARVRFAARVRLAGTMHRALTAAPATVPAIAGSIFPGSTGAAFTLQQRVGNSWHTVTHATLTSGGKYSVPVTGSGVYRVVYRGLDGPTVSVH